MACVIDERSANLLMGKESFGVVVKFRDDSHLNLIKFGFKKSYDVLVLE